MIDIVRALHNCYEVGTRAALATILSVEGSTYRREGVRCLIQEDGQIIGIVSGGCVEGDIAEHATEVWTSFTPKQISYDFRGADDLLWGLGLGCNGALTLFLQPFDPVHHPAEAKALLDWFDRRLDTRSSYIAATVITSAAPDQLPAGHVFDAEDDDARLAAWKRTGDAEIIDGTVENTDVQLFVEHVRPRTRLIVFGAGPDAIPVVRMGSFLQWRVTVVDHRSILATQARFPEADEVVVKPRGQYGELSLDDHTYTIIMTHNYEIDVTLLGQLLTSEAAYVGALGPRRRTEQMLTDLAENGLTPSALQLAKLHAPVGLDIGAESPEEIALAMVSEALARQHGRDGRSLSVRIGPLHERRTAPGEKAGAADDGHRS